MLRVVLGSGGRGTCWPSNPLTACLATADICSVSALMVECVSITTATMCVADMGSFRPMSSPTCSSSSSGCD